MFWLRNKKNDFQLRALISWGMFFTLNVFLISFEMVCYCSVTQPRDAVGFSAVCDCGISWSYTLMFYTYVLGVNFRVYSCHGTTNACANTCLQISYRLYQ